MKTLICLLLALLCMTGTAALAEDAFAVAEEAAIIQDAEAGIWSYEAPGLSIGITRCQDDRTPPRTNLV